MWSHRQGMPRWLGCLFKIPWQADDKATLFRPTAGVRGRRNESPVLVAASATLTSIVVSSHKCSPKSSREPPPLQPGRNCTRMLLIGRCRGKPWPQTRQREASTTTQSRASNAPQKRLDVQRSPGPEEGWQGKPPRCGSRAFTLAQLRDARVTD